MKYSCKQVPSHTSIHLLCKNPQECWCFLSRFCHDFTCHSRFLPRCSAAAGEGGCSPDTRGLFRLGLAGRLFRLRLLLLLSLELGHVACNGRHDVML